MKQKHLFLLDVYVAWSDLETHACMVEYQSNKRKNTFKKEKIQFVAWEHNYFLSVSLFIYRHTWDIKLINMTKNLKAVWSKQHQIQKCWSNFHTIRNCTLFTFIIIWILKVIPNFLRFNSTYIDSSKRPVKTAWIFFQLITWYNITLRFKNSGFSNSWMRPF